jgi:hypothetical protein
MENFYPVFKEGMDLLLTKFLPNKPAKSNPKVHRRNTKFRTFFQQPYVIKLKTESRAKNIK